MIKHLILLKIRNKYDGYQHGLASMVYKFFDEKASNGEIKKWKQF